MSGPGPSSSLNSQPRLFYVCPYYSFDPSKYRKCQVYNIEGNPRLMQHLNRTHMNWCGCCKEPFHTTKDLERHLRNGGCQLRAEFPVGYLNKGILGKIFKDLATGRANGQEHYYHIYKTLFKREPPTNTYSKFNTPAFNEAYGQVKLEAALRHMTHVIENLGEPQLSSGQSTSELLLALLRASSRGSLNPTDAQRRELNRLAMEKVQGSSGPTTLSSPSMSDLFAPSDRDITLCQTELKGYFTPVPHSTNKIDSRTQSDSQTQALTQLCPSDEREPVNL
ncbi:hypothetical protein HOO65_060301 [Ceratocystis lukuohia]|uniref:C2H2-type domain-containing protein n=1 Tax=Ceratocystis lukuohia TaxID=2019550 RepID=A0ABR4MDX0_9PEZI